MVDQTAAPSSSQTRVVAHVINGAVFSILATRKGLRSCLKKHEADPDKHCRMPSLQEFAQMMRAIEVLLPVNPNVDNPELNRRIGIRGFSESGEDYRDTGSSHVDHQRAGQTRSVAVI